MNRSAAAAATATEIAVSVARPRILIIDDDGPFVAKAREYFIGCGFDVDTARTPEEARQEYLKKYEYQLVAADISFAALSKTKGDRFVMENRSLFGKAKLVLISAGEWLTEERRDQLNAAEILFVEKNSNLNTKLAGITKKERDRWTKGIEKVVQSETVPSIQKITGGKVHMKIQPAGAATAGAGAKPSPSFDRTFTKMKQTLIKWLQTRGDLDMPVFAYGDRVYSANEMIAEVENGTKVGFDHVELMIGEWEHSLEIDSNAS
jgi:CheY-like chemotaxis protein